MARTIKTIPEDENTGPAMHILNKAGEKYIIVQNRTKLVFTLYRVLPDGKGYEKIDTSNGTPVPLRDMAFGAK